MDIQSILDIDREVFFWFNGSDSLFLDHFMSVLTSGLTWLPLYLSLFYLVVKNNETMQQILLIVGSASLCILLADGMADWIAKPLVARFRPSNDPAIKYLVHIVADRRGSPYGFFSAHAANTMSIAFFFCLLVKSKVLNISLILWSLVNCYTRLYLGMHYPLDILTGIVWGVIVGTVVYYLFYLKMYNKISPKLNYISTQYTSTGYALSDIDVVVNVLLLTLLFCTVYSLSL